MVEFLVLGPLEVKSGESTVDIGGPKPRTLLAHLIASANGGVSTEALIDRMWGEDPPASAANSLQTYVSRLRGVLGSDFIESLPTGYKLVVAPEDVDMLRFEALVAEGRDALGTDAAHAARVLTEAANLWRGRPFDGLADDDGALTPEVTRLEELQMTAVEDRITADLELGRHGVLSGEIEGLLDEHPYRERLWGLLMTALVRSGRQADALRAYQRARLILGDELGIEPSPELQEIEDQILLQDEALRTAPSPDTDVRNPFKGLAAFKEDDADDFFGRSHLVEQLLDHVREHRFMAVVGPSGSGKSSVVRAGLLPALRAGRIFHSERWVVASMVPGAHPFAELEGALLRAAPNPPASLMEQLRDEDLGVMRAVLRVLPDEDSELVLLVDQFEELFTLVESEETRQRFLRSLRLAVETPNSRLRVITTLRADFYDRPLLYPEFGKLFTGGMISVMPLSTVELEEAVHGPADRAGLTVEPSLVANLLADVATQPGALPLFQYTLTELFAARENSRLTLDSYEKIGGLRGALAGRADSLFDGLGGPAQRAARQLFLRLVAIGEHGEDSRRRVATAELEDIRVDKGAMQSAISAFGQHRLLTFDRNPLTGEATVEVAHEALLREWPRLQEWIQNARNDLRRHLSFRAAVDEWLAADRNPDYLLTGSRLENYEGWATKTTLELTKTEREFLDAGVARRDEEAAASAEAIAEREGLARRARRRLIAAGIAALIAVAVVVGVVLTVLSSPPRVAMVFEGRNTVIGALMGSGLDRATADFSFDLREVDPQASLEDDVQAAVTSGTELFVLGLRLLEFDIYSALAAIENDDLVLAVIDGAGPGAYDFDELEPVFQIDYAVEEGSFLVGAAAALTSTTGRIGYIGGMDVDFMWPFEAGFTAGAKAARPDVVVEAVYLSTAVDGDAGFGSPERAVAVATRMYEERGIDVIFTAAGFSGTGTLQAVDASSTKLGTQLWAIGVDADAYAQNLGQPAFREHILTSMIKRFDSGVYEAIRAYVSGEYEPGFVRLGLEDEGVGYTTTGNFLSADVISKLQQLEAAIIAGEITVPLRPEPGRVQWVAYLPAGSEADTALGAAFVEACFSEAPDPEMWAVIESLDSPLFGFIPVVDWCSTTGEVGAERTAQSCGSAQSTAVCKYTYEDIFTRAYGLPESHTWVLELEGGSIVNADLGIDQGDAFDSFFEWASTKYPDEWIAECSPDTATHKQCIAYQLRRFDEWAATLGS